MRLFVILVLGVGALIPVSCQKAETTSPSASAPPSYPTRAQPKLRTMDLYLGSQVMVTELALKPLEQQTGMMFRTNMAENEGMLFVYPAPQPVGFWMKNTPLPLSAAYIDHDGVIAEIHDLHPHDTNTVFSASDRIQFILETPRGWFQRNNVSTGAVVRTVRGGLAATFFPAR